MRAIILDVVHAALPDADIKIGQFDGGLNIWARWGMGKTYITADWDDDPVHIANIIIKRLREQQ